MPNDHLKDNKKNTRKEAGHDEAGFTTNTHQTTLTSSADSLYTKSGEAKRLTWTQSQPFKLATISC